MEITPSNLLSFDVKANPFNGLDAMSDLIHEPQKFIQFLYNTIYDTEAFEANKQELVASLMILPLSTEKPLNLFLAEKLGRKGSEINRMILRYYLYILNNQTSTERYMAKDGTYVVLPGTYLVSMALLLYYSTGYDLKYIDFRIREESTLTGGIQYDTSPSYLVLGVQVDQPIYPMICTLLPGFTIGPLGEDQALDVPGIYTSLSSLQKLPRSQPTDIYPAEVINRTKLLQMIRDQVTKVAGKSVSGYQWTVNNVLKALKSGFPDAQIELSDGSKTYSVDRTILGMFSRYFNIAFKTLVGSRPTIRAEFREEFEAYLAYMTGQSDEILDLANFNNTFAFLIHIRDDYLAVLLLQKLGGVLADIESSIEELERMKNLIDKYLSAINL